MREGHFCANALALFTPMARRQASFRSFSLLSATDIEGTDLRVLKYPHPALRANNEEIPAEHSLPELRA